MYILLDVRVSKAAVDDRLEVQVVDDGKGFDPQIAESSGGHGLQGMRFRVKACGGDLHIRSSAGNGTSVIATLPLPICAQGSAESAPPPQSTALEAV